MLISEIACLLSSQCNAIRTFSIQCAKALIDLINLKIQFVNSVLCLLNIFGSTLLTLDLVAQILQPTLGLNPFLANDSFNLSPKLVTNQRH